MSALRRCPRARKVSTQSGHANARPKGGRTGPRQRDRLAAMLVLLEQAWHLNATGSHTGQWEIARHLMRAAAAVTKAQRKPRARVQP